MASSIPGTLLTCTTCQSQDHTSQGKDDNIGMKTDQIKKQATHNRMRNIKLWVLLAWAIMAELGPVPPDKAAVTQEKVILTGT